MTKTLTYQKGFAMLLAALFIILPTVALAQSEVPSARTVNTISGMINLFSSILNSLIGLAITLGILIFIWGLIKYLWTVGESKAEGLQTMLWGTLAIFFMVSIWGLVNVLENTLNLDTSTGNAPTGPNTSGGSSVYNFNKMNPSR